MALYCITFDKRLFDHVHLALAVSDCICLSLYHIQQLEYRAVSLCFIQKVGDG